MKSYDPEEPEFYVYVLLDPRKPGKFKYGKLKFKHEPFYVGKGKAGRVFSHQQRSNRWVQNKIKKIQREGHIYLYDFLKEDLTEAEAYQLEIMTIDTIGRSDLKLGPLCNLSHGGEGASGAVQSKKTRQRRSTTVTKTWANYTQEQYEERCSNFREALASRSDERKASHRKNLSEARIAKFAAMSDIERCIQS